MANIREWLEKNKIFFETLAALLLSLMAVIISIVQISIGSHQTDLMEIQTKIAQKNLEREERLAEIQKSANWGELRNAIWKIFDQYPPQGCYVIAKLPKEQQILFFQKVREILDSQIKNPILIENRTCLGHWRNAISGAKTYYDILNKIEDTNQLDEAITNVSAGILRDVSKVWVEIISNSDEVSPTGGKP